MVNKQTGVRLPEELIKKVKYICIEKDITFQEAIKIATEEWVKKNSK